MQNSIVEKTQIVQATTLAHLDQVRTLMRAFVVWGRNLSAIDRDRVDRYFDEVEFERELAGLPGKYAPPLGSLLIAYHHEKPAGCVALRPLPGGFCEMKRMFVSPEFHGLGVGRALAERIMQNASSAGYDGIRLDTSKNQKAAMRLYESLGFRRIEAYYQISDDFKDWLIFFELKFQVSSRTK
ncbi:GNAT family N-acetyltransferase [Mesorhizobium sp. INR15]|uniref:GNAT family N-acetyltransferase n=1 Tax=Mesorhizobium sp. INR15 TaxID=2654248 RepID=UPI001896800C|nr:GNAT family N-acetyltransferase [Mesorhizobium sp. INR15]QPC95468.1 GNAT family N-acetyltransferase [Mesorhizobium sp. INR15]